MSLGDLIKQHSIKGINSLKLPDLMEAEVVSAPPELKIRLEGNDKLLIPKELIVVAEHLTKYKRKVTITNTGKTKISPPLTGVSVSMTELGNPPHVHPLKSFSISDSDFTLEEGEIEYLNELKKGDKVMVLSFAGGQRFFILDRIVTY